MLDSEDPSLSLAWLHNHVTIRSQGQKATLTGRGIKTRHPAYAEF